MTRSSYSDTARPGEAVITHAAMAILSLVAAGFVGWQLGWPWIVDINDPAFNPMIIVEALFVGVALWQGTLALRWWLRHRRFGATEMAIDGPVPVPLGRVLAGRLRSAAPVLATGDYQITLSCIDIHETGDTSGGASRTEEFPVWSETTTLPAATDATAGLRFRFDLPAFVVPKPVPALQRPNPYFQFKASINLPGFRRIFAHNAPPVGRRWQITVAAPTPGKDFRATFAVPVSED